MTHNEVCLKIDRLRNAKTITEIKSIVSEQLRDKSKVVEYCRDRYPQLVNRKPNTRDFWNIVRKNQIDELEATLTDNNDDDDNDDPLNLESRFDAFNQYEYINRYGFSYVADVIGWYDVEEAAKERSLANPKFWVKLQEAIDLGLIDKPTQTIDNSQCDIDNNPTVNNETFKDDSETLVKIEQNEVASVAPKNHSENTMVSKQQLLFNSELLPLVIRGEKTQTRRVWKDRTADLFIKAYRNQELIKVHSNPYNSRKKLEGYVRLTKEPYQESKKKMPNDDVKKEGFWNMTKQQFFDKFFPKSEDEYFWVLNFEFIPLPVEVESEVIYETSEKLQEDNGQYQLFDYWVFDRGYQLYQKFATNNFGLDDLDKLFTLSRHWIEKLAKKFNLWRLEQPLKDLAWLVKVKFKKQQLCL